MTPEMPFCSLWASKFDLPELPVRYLHSVPCNRVHQICRVPILNLQQKDHDFPLKKYGVHAKFLFPAKPVQTGSCSAAEQGRLLQYATKSMAESAHLPVFQGLHVLIDHDFPGHFFHIYHFQEVP